MRYMESIKERVKKKDFKAELINLLDFDCDISGENGDEYLWQEAKDRGFSTNAEYIVDDAINTYGETDDAIEHALRKVFDDSFYTVWDIHLEERIHFYIVMIGYSHQG